MESRFFDTHIEQEPHRLRCSQCGCTDVIRRGTVERRFRTLPIGNKAVWVVLPVQRVYCPTCEHVRQVNVTFADDRRSYTHAKE